MRGLLKVLRKNPALLLLVAVYALASGVIFVQWLGSLDTADEDTGGRIVLRIAHWQLEPGIQKAMDSIIAEYEEQYPSTHDGQEVEVRQILIPEVAYFQWVNTQLIGKTAPDMIECGMGSWVLWQKFYARYFLPLDRYVDKPNPYNKGTELEGLAWRDTYFDGMEGGYESTLQAYYRVPLSTFTVRLYYNKSLVDLVANEKWGDDRPWEGDFPATFQGLTALCDALNEHWAAEGEEGSRKAPIAGSSYSVTRFLDEYMAAMTASLIDGLDVDNGGSVQPIEAGAQIYSGELSLHNDHIRASFGLLQELTDYFPDGFMSFDRDQATFMFMQQRAAMIVTGSWDFGELGMAEDFEVAVADIPMPAGHPVYGEFYDGPKSEADTRGAFPIGIAKFSKHPEQAVDFLQFLSSKKYNELLNRRMRWLPVVKDADVYPDLEPFKARKEGFTRAMDMPRLPSMDTAFNQKLPLLLEEYYPGPKTPDAQYEKFVEDYMNTFRAEFPRGVTKTISGYKNALAQQLRFAVTRRAALNGLPGADAPLGRGAGTGEEALENMRVQYLRIMEAYVSQINNRTTDMLTWAENAEDKITTYSAE